MSTWAARWQSGWAPKLSYRAGPHGYVHGWIYVGAGGLAAAHALKAGDRVKGRHPLYGEIEGSVTKVGKTGNLTTELRHTDRLGEVNIPGVGLNRGSVTHVGKEAADRLGESPREKMGAFGDLRDSVLKLKNDLANSGRLGPNGQPVPTSEAVKALGRASFAITSGNPKEAREHLTSAYAWLARVDRGNPLLAQIREAISEFDRLHKAAL